MNERFKAKELGSVGSDRGLRELSLDELDFVSGATDRRRSNEGRTTGPDVDFINGVVDWVRQRWPF